ncbi:MAG: hypothetical protein IPM11_01635 [Micropruina sp.]|nr:hypothetical protein [Micropruina sp.]
MTGTDYDCTGATCTAKSALAAGADGPAITLVATIDNGFNGTAHNVAYVSPDADDIDETNPLVVPTTTTDTSKTDTDNDAQADLKVDLVSIGDYVWRDVDRDGQQDQGEAPVSGSPSICSRPTASPRARPRRRTPTATTTSTTCSRTPTSSSSPSPTDRLVVHDADDRRDGVRLEPGDRHRLRPGEDPGLRLEQDGARPDRRPDDRRGPGQGQPDPCPSRSTRPARSSWARTSPYTLIPHNDGPVAALRAGR